MIETFFILSVLFGIYVVKKSHNLYGYYLNHYSILNIWWLSTLFLSFFNTAIFIPLDETYCIFFIGLFSFNITVFFLDKAVKVNTKPRVSIINIKLKRIIEILVIVSIIPYVIKNFYLVLSGVDLATIHQDYFNGEVIEDNEYKFKVFIIEPVVNILLLLCFYRWTNSTSKYTIKLNFVLILIILLSFTFVSGGRTELLMFIIIYFLVYGFSKIKVFKPYLINNLNINLIYFIPLFFLFQLISIERKHGEGESFFNTILVSYSLYVGIFDYYVRHPAIAFNELTWGFSSFESIIILSKSLFRNLLGISVFDDYKIANEYIQKFVPIGRDFKANAYATMYFKFIRDWGYLGIFIGPIFLAIIYHRLNNLIRKNGMYALFYIYSCYMLTQTTNMFSNTTLCYLLVFIYLSLLVKYLPNFRLKYIIKR